MEFVLFDFEIYVLFLVHVFICCICHFVYIYLGFPSELSSFMQIFFLYDDIWLQKGHECCAEYRA